jgi:malate dehydrogenase (oxaloacetate-decarboxylating)
MTRPGAPGETPDERALRRHAFYRGKVQTLPKCPIGTLADFAVWYTPGVAAPCLAIRADPASAYRYTNKGNTIAVVSNGTRVLGLGDIGPAAGLPVMEGKALLFKYLGGVDAVPLCIDARAAEDVVRVVEAVAPSFGGINLEDIAQPMCFRVLAAARQRLPIPVWHDDQQGSATAVLAGLMNALSLVGKELRRVRIALVGIGAANVSTYRLLKAAGADAGAIVACDSRGTLHRGRADIGAQRATFEEKWQVCCESNADGIVGGVDAALRGADVCLAFAGSGPGIVSTAAVRAMNRAAIVFACGNPVPEIWPDDARAAGARIVATGRSDFQNQVNNALVFPGLFRGVLDVQASAITDEMALAAAHAVASAIPREQLADDRILPRLDDASLAADVAAAVGAAAQRQGLARVAWDAARLRANALGVITQARAATAALIESGAIAAGNATGD